MTWTQGSLLELTITDLAAGGDGVARWDNRVIFVPNTVPGDQVQVRLLHVKRREAFGQVTEILTASPQRVRPACIVADKCGGCQWQSVAYHRQTLAKQAHVEKLLAQAVAPIWRADPTLHYRNKVTYPLAYTKSGEIAVGYYRQGSHQVVNINQCPVQDPYFDQLLPVLKAQLKKQNWPIYDQVTGTGLLRHLGLRIGRRTGEVLVTLVATKKPLGIEVWAAELRKAFPQIVGVSWNQQAAVGNAIFGTTSYVVSGRDYLRELFCGLEFYVGATTFFQIYTEQAEKLVNFVVASAQLTGNETVVDAYCGIGTLSLPLAQRAKYVIGIESWEDSVTQARANAQRNGLDNCTFVTAKVEDWLPIQTEIPNVLCLDPPRKGCDPAVLDAILRHPPHRLIYVSCNPATLARDLQILKNGGYQVIHVQPIDFFPQTYHVECVAVLELAALTI